MEISNFKPYDVVAQQCDFSLISIEYYSIGDVAFYYVRRANQESPVEHCVMAVFKSSDGVILDCYFPRLALARRFFGKYHSNHPHLFWSRVISKQLPLLHNALSIGSSFYKFMVLA